jgi:thiol-disulfide isomerase/thioredoxin
MELLKGIPRLTSSTIGALLVTLLLLTAAPCHAESCPLPLKNGMVKNRVSTGRITEEQLYREFPEWKGLAARYTPRTEIVQKLRKVASRIEVVLFFGTWCQDANDEVPKLLKICAEVGNAAFLLKIYAVDRKKREESGLAEKLRINRVPTIVLFQGEKELGRIIERPHTSMEEDLLAIIHSSR